MALPRDTPYVNAHFLVDLGRRGEDPRAPHAGFCEVVLPTLHAEPDKPMVHASDAAGQAERLILRRGLCGRTDLADWFAQARRGRAPRNRTVIVSLLAEDRASVVFTWRFRQARPISLHYSPLDAMQGHVVVESLTLAFDSVEID
jgi:phage tail-like protein